MLRCGQDPQLNPETFGCAKASTFSFDLGVCQLLFVLSNTSPRLDNCSFVLLSSVPGYDQEWKRREILRTEKKVDEDKKTRKQIDDRKLIQDLFTT